MSRLGYVDWMRGLAVLVMMQTHAYDSWLTPEGKRTAFFGYSRLIGGAPAPLFLFLAGVSLALLLERHPVRTDGGTEARRVGRGIRRGLQVLGYAFLFRAFLLITGGFGRPRDFLRVDVLNCIGLSMALVAAVALPWPTPRKRVLAGLALAAAIAVATPAVWDAPWPGWIPVPLLAYVSGRVPDALFPLFPWTAFAAAGAAVGTLLARARGASRETLLVAALALAGVVAITTGLRLDRLPTFWAPYDFWYTSPNYLLIRLGLLLLILGIAVLWDRRPGRHGAGFLPTLGRESLLIYAVHIEIVYGGILVPFARGRLGILGASVGLLILTAAMWLLAFLRSRPRVAPPAAVVTARGNPRTP